MGNSYGGMVITGVSAKIPERLKLLVYLDAYLPEAGQSEADLLPVEMFASRRADAEANHGLIKPPPPRIFGITDPALEDWVKARMTPHPLASYTEQAPAGKSGSMALPGVFVHCTGNPATTPDLFAASAAKAKAKGWPVIDLAAGHLAMLTAPIQLAELLLSYHSEN